MLANIQVGGSELDTFLKVFPRILFFFISQFTNERLEILREDKKKQDFNRST